MAERKYVIENNGQEVQKEDLEMLGETAGYADDRVLWELIRTLKGSATPQKLIVTSGNRGWFDPHTGTIDSTALVVGEKADASVRVMPFRAVVGSTTLVGTSVIEHLRGMRSGYAVGASTLHTVKTLANNGSGNPRWDLIYATVVPDGNGDNDTRYKKDPTTEVVTSSAVTLNKRTLVSINVAQGTPGASPTRPALPADGGGAYQIALAYVWVPSAHNGTTSVVARSQIVTIAECATINSALGTSACEPANGQYKIGGAVDTRQGHNQLLRPGGFLPSTMVGGNSKLILLQRGLAPLSHNDGDVVDDSIDWRYRLFRFFIKAKAGSSAAAAFVSDRNGTGISRAGSAIARTWGAAAFAGSGQSFIDDSTDGIAVGDSIGVALYADNTNLSELGGSTAIQIYVRNTDGALVFKQSGSGTFQALIWLDASAPYSDFGTV